MRTNRLLHGTVVVAATYWVVGFIAPPDATRALAAILLVVSSGLVFFRYAPRTWEVVWRKLRDDATGRGSHLAVMGAALAGGGLFYSGCYTLLWLASGSPDHWNQLPYGPFGRYVAAWGLLLFFFSPDVEFARLHPSRWTFGAVAVLLAIVTALVIGIQIGKTAFP